jgi:hypothetical protein
MHIFSSDKCVERPGVQEFSDDKYAYRRGKKSPVKGRIWEDIIASELSAHDVTTTPSYRLFADSLPDPGQPQALFKRKNSMESFLSGNWKTGSL